MKILLSVFFLLFHSQAEKPQLQNGDLIFQEACTGNTDNTIKEVTSSIDGYRFTHVGIVYIDQKDSIYVIEATHPKVKVTHLNEYLYPEGKEGCYPISVVGRLKEEYRHCIPQALEEGLKLVGKNYDYGYTLNNDTYYCSELVYYILLKANNGKPVFELNTMTFKSAETGEFTEGWISYYEKLNMPIPEGEPGINPGAMSRSHVIDIVGRY
ncbi:MAG: YiiX/YebB-like N1pC/P60 family cysteine hydrolase [Dysgonomonas sp.]|nr:YiiX/YebB-like N1pC/P60 family cysteine hydrolase [Dysgonomonas sp.]